MRTMHRCLFSDGFSSGMRRSLKMPPDAIRDVLEGVLMVLGQQDTSWNNMKKFLGVSSVKEDIVNYDARKITDDVRNRVRRSLLFV